MKTFHRSKSTLHLVRACGIGVDPVAAQRRTIGFYRSSAMPWVQALG
jgi:hypothetical protein